MSVLIKGMEMPKTCIDCPFSDHEAWCLIPGSWRERYYCPKDEISEHCPLIEVPEPHGLIDREQILDSIRLELAQANAVNDMDDYDSWVRVFDYVRKFPTVIHASEEGKT